MDEVATTTTTTPTTASAAANNKYKNYLIDKLLNEQQQQTTTPVKTLENKSVRLKYKGVLYLPIEKNLKNHLIYSTNPFFSFFSSSGKID